MEKMLGRTQYNTARDTKIVGAKGSSLFIASTEKLYLYSGEEQIQVMEMDEVRDWIKNNRMNFSPDELKRIGRYVVFEVD